MELTRLIPSYAATYPDIAITSRRDDTAIIRRRKYYVQQNIVVKRIFGIMAGLCESCAKNDTDISGESALEVKPADRLLAYDIGGSHVTVGLCLLKPLKVLRIAVAPLPDTICSDAFLDLLQQLGQQLIGGVDRVAGACLAFPGPFVYGTGVSHMRHKLKALYGVDLKTALADRLGWTPERIRFLNDADAALLGEVGAGAAKGAARAAGIMLGTGIGFSFVCNGILNDAIRGVPPDREIWNLPFLDGIVEDVLSARGIERDYEARTAKHPSVAAIAVEAAVDPNARAVFDTFGRHLGQMIKEILASLAPEVVVFGGGISRSAHLFLPAARSQIKGLGIQLVPSVLREKAPLLGAAMFWRDYASSQSDNHSTLAIRP
jgi:glucokinase